MAKLASTVYVQDPDTHQTVTLDEGTSPEPRLAALVTNPAAWVDRKPPRLPKQTAQPKADGQQDGDPTGAGPDDASGASSAASADGDQANPPAKKTAAAKRAASKPARGRDAAAEGTSGD